MTSPLTWLYVPATRPELLPKALATGADVVIVDLEDSVLPSAKDEARQALRRTLDDQPDGPPVHVRVNPVRAEAGRADLAAFAGHPRVSGVRLTKIEDAKEVAVARQLLGGAAAPPLHCLIESARGVEACSAIARAVGVAGISLGEADLVAELSLSGEEGLAWIRSRLVVAAAAAGLPPPSMSVYRDLHDDAGLAASCRRGRDLGMWGRAAIHPRQVPIIRHAFVPTEDKVARAQEVLDAADRAERDGSGAVALADGRFVDPAVVAAARRVIAQRSTP